MKLTAITLSILYCALNYAQDVSNYISSLSSNVVIFNNSSIVSKTKEAQIDGYDFYKEFKSNSKRMLDGADADEELVPLLLSNLSSFGLAEEGKSIMYYYSGDSLSYTGFIASYTDEKLLSETEEAILASDEEVTEGIGKGYSYKFTNSEIIAKNGEVVLFAEYKEPYFWGGFETEIVEELGEEYYESYEERYKAEEEKKKARKKLKIESALNSIFNLEPNLSLASSNRFKGVYNGTYDMAYFADANNNSSFNEGMRMFMGYRGRSSAENLMSMFSDNYTWAYLNIEEEAISMKTYSSMSEEWKKRMVEMNKAKMNTALLKYISGDNIIGYMSMAVNPEPMYEMTMDMYAKVLSAFDRDETGAAEAGVNVFKTLLDEEELFDLIRGKAVFAVTDLKEFDVTYTSYEFDEEYNETEVIKTKRELFPEYVFVAEVGNKKLRDNIIKLYEAGELLIKEGDYYKYKRPRYGLFGSFGRSSSDINNYVAFYNDVMIVSNDEDLIKNKLKTGVPTSEMLSSDLVKHLKKNNYTAYWNSDNMSKSVLNSNEIEKEVKDVMTIFSSTFSTAQMTGVKKEGDIFTSSATIEMKNKEKPAVASILDMIQQVYDMERR